MDPCALHLLPLDQIDLEWMMEMEQMCVSLHGLEVEAVGATGGGHQTIEGLADPSHWPLGPPPLLGS